MSVHRIAKSAFDCRMLITLSLQFETVWTQVRQKEGLDYFVTTLVIFLKEFCENVKVEKSTGDTISVKKD